MKNIHKEELIPGFSADFPHISSYVELDKYIDRHVPWHSHIGKNGGKQNINKQYFMQTKMMEQYRENKNYLPLEIEASDPEDYMKIVFFTIGDC